jgi:hypothetical protein
VTQVRQVSFLAARAREDADRSGACAQQMLVALKLLEGGPADLDHTEDTAKECLELSAVGSGAPFHPPSHGACAGSDGSANGGLGSAVSLWGLDDISATLVCVLS